MDQGTETVVRKFSVYILQSLVKRHLGGKWGQLRLPKIQELQSKKETVSLSRC